MIGEYSRSIGCDFYLFALHERISVQVFLGYPATAPLNQVAVMFIRRGPTWIMLNWFIQQPLLNKGFKKESREMVVNVIKPIEKSGLREYYNPFTSEGYVAKDFTTWSGLVLDMIKMEKSYNA